MSNSTETLTSRERPKSAPYLRLKIEKGYPSGFVKLQLVAKNEKKMKGGPFGDMKKFSKYFLNKTFEQCYSAEKYKKGPFAIFLTSIVLQNIETNERGTLWCNPKSFKKSQCRKKWGYGEILSEISRFWTSVLFLLFGLDGLLTLELLRFEVVEV